MREIGAYSVNNVLQLENRDPIGPVGDLRHVPGNWMILKEAEPVPPPMLPAPKPDEAEDENEASVVPPTQGDVGEQVPPTSPPMSTDIEWATNCRTFGVLIDDAAERLASAEIRELERHAPKAAEDRERFNAWVDTFYASHAKYVAKALAPIARAWREATGNDCDAEVIMAEIMEYAELLKVCPDPVATTADWRHDNFRAFCLADAWYTAFGINDPDDNESDNPAPAVTEPDEAGNKERDDDDNE
jgi:hypothetical protein